MHALLSNLSIAQLPLPPSFMVGGRPYGIATPAAGAEGGSSSSRVAPGTSPPSSSTTRGVHSTRSSLSTSSSSSGSGSSSRGSPSQSLGGSRWVWYPVGHP